jgi:hypothetical protein
MAGLGVAVNYSKSLKPFGFELAPETTSQSLRPISLIGFATIYAIGIIQINLISSSVIQSKQFNENCHLVTYKLK